MKKGRVIIMSKLFPRTQVEGVSLSRMIIGTNWILGWSHTGAAADRMITKRYDTREKMCEILEAYMEYGIDTIMAPFGLSQNLVDAVKATEQKLGKPMIMVDTPCINVDNTKEGRKEAEKVITACGQRGSRICLLHHSSVEQLVNKNKGIIDRLPDYTSMIRDAGLIPGLSAHMPELITYSDDNNYDVQTYIQIYNCMGFLMQIEVETVARIIHNAKKPVMTIKPIAAGRTTPFVGLNFAWNTLRECDMVTVGAFQADEVHEDVEISFAALERRLPDLEKRQSPANNQAAFGK